MKFRRAVLLLLALFSTLVAAHAETSVYSKAEVDAIIAALPSGGGGGGSSPPASTLGWKDIVSDYGAACDGITLDDAAFTAAINDINAGTLNRLRVPTMPGSGPNNPTKCRIGSQLPSIQSQGFHLAGDGMWETQIIRDYNGTTGVGLLNILGASIGVEISDITIASAAGRSGGSAIYFQAGTGSGYTGAQTKLRNVNLTTYGTDSWDRTLWVNGTAKTIDPKGWRTFAMENVLVFGANGYSAQFSSVVGLTWYGGGAFAAGGTAAQSGGILITGTAAVPSTSISMQIESANGIALDNCSYAIIESAIIGNIGGVSVSAASSCDHLWIRGFRTGSYSLNAATSYVQP